MIEIIGQIAESEKAEGLISSLYSLLIVTIVLFIGIEAAGYSMTAWKLRQVCMETLNLMKVESGLDYQVESHFNDLIHSYGLDNLSMEIQGTPQYVQRGDLLEFRAQSSYKLNCLRPLGQEVEVPLNINVKGLSHTYLRDDDL